MRKQEFLQLMDDLLEQPSGTLAGSERLADMESWSSLSAVGFMALADEHFGIWPSADDLAGAATVDDLIALLGDAVGQPQAA